MIKYIILDSNIFRRLLENNVNVEAKLKQLKQSYDFAVSDMSLFEVIDYIETLPFEDNLQKTKLLKLFLFNNKVRILKKKGFDRTEEVYKRYVFDKFSNIQLKNNLLSSFAWTVSRFITNLYCLTVVNVANSIETNFKSYFYNYIRTIVDPTNKKNIYDRFPKIIEQAVIKSYTEKSFKFNNYVKDKFKEIIIDLLTIFYFSSNELDYTDEDYNRKFKELENQYKSLSFKEILCQIIDEQKIYLNKIPEMDELDFIFISKYLTRLNISNPKFSINDITDYHNFINAYRNNALYFTFDKNSFKVYKNVFDTDSSIQNFISKCETIK